MYRVFYNGIRRGMRTIAPAGSKVCSSIEEVRSAVADLETKGFPIWAITDPSGAKIAL